MARVSMPSRVSMTTPVWPRTALKVPLILAGSATLTRAPRASAAGRGRWSADRAISWYRAQRRLVGAHYIPSNAINQLEMFQPDTYNPRRIDAELGMARNLGLNTVRVFLHDLLWVQGRHGFLRRHRLGSSGGDGYLNRRIASTPRRCAMLCYRSTAITRSSSASKARNAT
jgi:hypothetical protein